MHLLRERDAVLAAFRGATCPSRTLLVVGEPGVGKRTFCAPLARVLGGPIVANIDAADDEEIAPHLRRIRRSPEPFFATSSCALSDPGFPDALRPYFPWSVVIPPLRTRPEDVALYVHHHLARLGAAEKRVASDLMERFVSAEWRGNVRALCTEVERLHFLDPDDAVLQDVDRSPARSLAPCSATSPATSLRIALDASSICVAERPVDLRRRPVLRKVLHALVKAHAAGGALTVAELGTLAWPGEKLLAPAVKNRVYVAMASLRRLGLHSCIESTDAGYALTPSVIIE